MLPGMASAGDEHHVTLSVGTVHTGTYTQDCCLGVEGTFKQACLIVNMGPENGENLMAFI